MAELFFKMATIFLNLKQIVKKLIRQRLYTPESSKIELFEGEKVFSDTGTMICNFGSGLTVQICVLLKAVKA